MVEIPAGGWAIQYTDSKAVGGYLYGAELKPLGKLTPQECKELSKVHRRQKGSYPAMRQGDDGWIDVLVMGDYGSFAKWRDEAIAYLEQDRK